MDSTANTLEQQLLDTAEIRRTLQLLLPDGQVVEIRALEATTRQDRWPHTASGYFDDPEKLIEALVTINSAKGVYITLNPVESALLARAANRIRKAPRGESTSNTNIVARRWLLIDCDAQRPAGISATDDEHQAALDRAATIRDTLHHNYGWPDPVEADSGNGGHLLYQVDLSRDDDGLVQRCLATLAAQFDDDRVKIDTAVHNPARITKLYGTLVCKGDSTPDRPHRMSRIFGAPDQVQVVDWSLLESLASEAPAGPPRDDSHIANGQPFDIDSFITRYGFEVDGPDPYQGGRRWTFRKSPLCDHDDDGPYLIQFPSGALSAGCHHNSCAWGWHDLRAKYEPKPDTGLYDRLLAKVSGNRLHEKPEKQANLLPLPAVAVEKYTPFPVETLPATVGKYVSAAASAIGCDPAYIALPLLASLARAIGNKRVIRLKRTWTEPSIIWAAIIGKSGTHKTPAMQAAMHDLQRKQAEAIAQHAEGLGKYQEEKAIYDRDYAAWKRSKTSEPPPWPPQEPVCHRYLTTDTTIEALAALLASQFDGLLVSRDELAGWLGGIAEYKGGRGSDLGHWLAMWSAAPLTVDRKTGAIKMLHIPRAAVSIIGGIQPGVLQVAIGQEHLQDGLCARLLLAMPEPQKIVWTEATIDSVTEAATGNMFDRLLSLTPGADEEGQPMPFPIPLSPAAKQVWVDYYNRHREELIGLDDDLAAAWSKLEAYTARLALIFQLSGWAAGEDQYREDEVDQRSMEAAVILSDWFGGEARRVYGLFVERAEDRAVRELVELIGRHGGRITSRELARASRRYRGAGEAEAALDGLAQAGYGRWDVIPTATNQKRVFTLVRPVTVTHSPKSRVLSESVTVTAVTSPEKHTNG